MSLKRDLSFIIFFLLSSSVNAATPTFDNITDADMETISKEFSSVFVHTSVTPPTGSLLGIQAAVVAGVAEVPGIADISKRVDPTSDIKYAPFAWLYGAVGLPAGFTVEANILPKYETNGFELSHYGGGLRYSLTDQILPMLPFDLSIRTYYSKSKIEFNQYIAPGTVNVDFENNMYGAEALFGVNLLVVEPYAGIGFVKSDTELSGSSTVDPSFSMFVDNISRSKKSSVDSARVILGLQFNLTILKIGLEYNNVFGSNRYAAKLGVGF